MPVSLRQNCSAKVTPLVSTFAHTVHSYQGVSPWDACGRRLLYLGFETGQPASVVVRDLQSGTERAVASTENYNYHCAAWQQWILADSAVAYRGSGDERGGALGIVELATGVASLREDRSIRELRYVTPGGDFAYTTSHNDHAPAVCRVNLHTLEAQRLLSVEEAKAATPQEFHDPADCYVFSHPVPNPDQTLLFVKFERVTQPLPMHANGNENWGAFLVLDLRTRQIRCLGNRISGHPIWMPDGRHILNIKKPLDGSDNRWLVLVDSHTGEDYRLVDQPIEGPGHPVPSPDGQWVVTDAYTADHQSCPIYLIHIASGIVREIARLPHHVRLSTRYDPSKIYRANPHPVWSPSGKQILVNCNHAGQGMRLLLLEEFLP